MVDLVGHAFGIEVAEHGVEVGLAVRAFVLEDDGGGRSELLAGGDFAVQHAQGIGFHAALAVGAELVLIEGGKPVMQGLAVLRAAGSTAEGVDLQGEVLQAQLAKEFHHHADDLGVGFRLLGAEAFAVDLMELAHTALLGTFVTEHGADGEELAHGFAGVHTVFDVGAHDACRGFRAQGHGAALAVLYAVHFLLHHVGLGTDAAAEKVGIFHEGGAKFTETVAGEHLAGRSLHHFEKAGRILKMIGKALDSLNLCHD